VLPSLENSIHKIVRNVHTLTSVSFQYECVMQHVIECVAVVMRGVYKDLLLLTTADRILDYGELRNRVSCICDTVCVC